MLSLYRVMKQLLNKSAEKKFNDFHSWTKIIYADVRF
jgi:hypothetical protein